MKMGAKLGLSLMLMFVTVATGFSTTPPPVTEQTLQKIAGSLEMYVDLLPQMPKIYGYSMEGGSPKPVKLTIGMYEKKWVRLIKILNLNCMIPHNLEYTHKKVHYFHN